MRYVILLIERIPNLFLEIFYLSYSQRAWVQRFARALIGSGKKVQLFVVFIGSSAAPWPADSKNVYMSIANIVLSGSKLRKTSGNLQFREIFDQLAITFAMDMYTFLESACQGAADERIKNPKTFLVFLLAHWLRLGPLIPKMYTCP